MKKSSKKLVAVAAGMVVSSTSFAFNFETGSPDLTVSWDNTLKYSTSFRVRDVDPNVAPAGWAGFSGQVNANDGDRNFGKGLISNRMDILSELGVRYKRNSGFRISATAWYDDVYLRSNDRSASDAAGLNQTGTYNQFNDGTKKTMGRNAELLDFFGYTRQSVGDMGLNLKAGRFTQLYGESLFFGNNGIAGAQTPLDLARALSVPNSQFKEVARPVGQVSAQLQVNPNLTLGAYIQPEWRESRLPASGSYFSFGDFVGAGGEMLYVPPALSSTSLLTRGADNKPDSGQWGGQIRYKNGDNEYGLYAANFHEKLPQFLVRPNQDYSLFYGENIHMIGGSVSTVVGDTNVASEISYRTKMPLVAMGSTIVGFGDPNSIVPKGNTLHINISAISVFRGNSIWDGASLVSEVAFNRRLRVTENPDQVDPNATRDAGALQFVFAPEYFQVMSETDLSIPIGVSYGLFGRSSVNGVLFPAEHGGSVSIGAKAVYKKALQVGINYTHYIGDAGAIITSGNPPLNSYQNFHRDRDYLSLSAQYSF